jgi:hypothetical protein
LEYVDNKSYTMKHDWLPDMNTGVEYLSFKIGEHSYAVHLYDSTGKKVGVTRELFASTVASVKAKCSEAASCLITELKERFADTMLLSAFAIFFPQYWKDPNAEKNFPEHLKYIKKHFGVARTYVDTKGVTMKVPALLCPEKLSSQAPVFRSTMTCNWSAAMGEPFDMNPISKLWQILDANALLRVRMSEFFKAAKLCIVTLIGSVEDERTFSNLAFVKNKLRNRLTTNLDIVVKLFAQKFWSLEEFPYQDAITDWLNVWERRCARL